MVAPCSPKNLPWKPLPLLRRPGATAQSTRFPTAVSSGPWPERLGTKARGAPGKSKCAAQQMPRLDDPQEACHLHERYYSGNCQAPRQCRKRPGSKCRTFHDECQAHCTIHRSHHHRRKGRHCSLQVHLLLRKGCTEPWAVSPTWPQGTAPPRSKAIVPVVLAHGQLRP